MNSIAVVTFVACLAAANAGYLHGPSSHILQGPSSKTTLIGPEGSVISAVAPEGHIAHEEHSGVVAHAAPAHSHIVAYAAPAVAHHEASVLSHHAPATAIAHSSAYGHEGALVSGPSGTISTGYAVHAAPVVAHSVPAVAYGPIGIYGHEGQYVHDHSEALYDDGSYKPHLYHH